eukprot:GFUD01078697.1.p1 GENE.GFUD01078697.1~~GFUD01078697.1.p1  ORF type:complete len:455 (+),score=132.36 GFUD01078697.1:35-1366(+)
MRSQWLVTAILFALTCSLAKGSDLIGNENKRDIEEIARVLRETVKEDLETLFNQHNKLVEQTIDVMEKSLAYVDKFAEDIKTHLEKRIDDMDVNTMNNFELLEANTNDMLTKMNETLTTNLDNINQQSKEERNEIIWWAHHRAHLHEDILKTRITACAYDYGHFGKGVVNYNSKDGGYIADSVSIRVFNNTDIKKEDVLNRDTGVFKVPQHAAGEYIFTFSVTIDSFDQKLMPSAYYFQKNGERIEGTKIYADIGFSKIHDRVPGSRTIFLKLEENDEVSVIQTKHTDIHDLHVSFCGALLHLEKASESPGGLFADDSNTKFPAGTLAEQNAWEDEFPGFKDATPVDFFHPALYITLLVNSSAPHLNHDIPCSSMPCSPNYGYLGLTQCPRLAGSDLLLYCPNFDYKERKEKDVLVPIKDLLKEPKMRAEDWKTETADWELEE